MKSLGVNPFANGLWLACADGSRLATTDPYLLSLPSGMESGDKLVALLDECERVLRDFVPDRVLILDPEPRNQITFTQARGRITGETLLALAAARAGIPCDHLTRARLRSRLGLDPKGKLAELVPQVIAEPQNPRWKDGRDLAALAALAGQDRGSRC